MLPSVLDFGFGTFKDEPVVGVTMQGRHFHRADHRPKLDMVTFTYGYVTDASALGLWQPCRQCFPGHPPVPAPAQDDGGEA